MNLLLIRKIKNKEAIIGDLSIDGDHECFILENPGLAVPEGCYQVALTYSPRFGRILPELLSVEGREGIRIHPGNTSHDSTGCLLPGTTHTNTAVVNSRIAFNALLARLEKAIDPIRITIKSM